MTAISLVLEKGWDKVAKTVPEKTDSKINASVPLINFNLCDKEKLNRHNQTSKRGKKVPEKADKLWIQPNATISYQVICHTGTIQIQAR